MVASIWMFQTEIRASIHWRYVAEVVTGNWSPDQPKDKVDEKGNAKDYITDGEYAVGLIGALLVGYAPYIALISLVYKIIVERRRRVINLGQAMAVREETAKNYLVDVFSKVMSPEEASENVSKAFLQMEDWWQSRLKRMIGQEGVEQVLRDMSRPIESAPR